MDSASGRGARDLHLPDCAFDQECAFQTWCLLEELSLFSTIPLVMQPLFLLCAIGLPVWYRWREWFCLRQTCIYKSLAHVHKWRFPLKFIISVANVTLWWFYLLRNQVFKKSEKQLFSDTAYLRYYTSYFLNAFRKGVFLLVVFISIFLGRKSWLSIVTVGWCFKESWENFKNKKPNVKLHKARQTKEKL